MELSNLVIIFFVAALAASFGTLIGGSSIVTIPTLILLGLPPHTAIGTDRFGIIGVGAAGWYKFHKMGHINYRVGFTTAIPVFIGTIIGSNLVLQISEGILKNVIVVANIIIVVFMMVNHKIGIRKRSTEIRKREIILGVFFSFLVGVYGGFYGALAGTFSLYILVLWFRQTFIQSAATLKISATFMTVTASTIFAMNGTLDFYLGTAMFSGCFLGAYVGAHYAERIGDVWIKRLFLLFMVFVIAKLMLS
ncbi:MAG: sulfite exporter TauE/SafE family protein [Pseudomonadota bacterium]